ncbi:hypothetical protein M406DRAFT_350927 [Cryphonectria parasitica EP155]|uniref:Uncharacterized protein n=1 Tax=Cryphonectria parasitica (strain ATCC 38755 / EP155) TaxID=660469 RepID=A0A9P5CPK9_CRYP1|nr:uncharacterized protein M406DRAFT_350927 [Cryphonectria parasitica EP155]KAF3765276.1 hypothetical protein M406DRAFT_350927 [Cryphonectria parasitica EP155]
MSRRASSSEEAAPFLDDPEAPLAPGCHKEAAALGSLKGRLLVRGIAISKSILWLNILLSIANAAWTIVNLQPRHGSRSSSGRPRGGIYEATGAPMSLVNSTWNLPIGTRSPFTDLDPAVADAAWATVNMGGKQGWLKVPKAKVDLMDQSSIEFADGSGYLFGMDVFHQLHCLDFLRKKTVLYHPFYPVVEEDEDIPVAYHIALGRWMDRALGRLDQPSSMP